MLLILYLYFSILLPISAFDCLPSFQCGYHYGSKRDFIRERRRIWESEVWNHTEPSSSQTPLLYYSVSPIRNDNTTSPEPVALLSGFNETFKLDLCAALHSPFRYSFVWFPKGQVESSQVIAWPWTNQEAVKC